MTITFLHPITRQTVSGTVVSRQVQTGEYRVSLDSDGSFLYVRSDDVR